MTMGGGLSSWQKKGLSLFGVCLFLGVREKGVRQKKNGGNKWTGPPTKTDDVLHCLCRHPSLSAPGPGTTRKIGTLWATQAHVICFNLQCGGCFGQQNTTDCEIERGLGAQALGGQHSSKKKQSSRRWHRWWRGILYVISLQQNI